MEESDRSISAVPIRTLGELFPDGTGIERLRENLVLWYEGAETIAPQVEFSGHIYSPAPLPSDLQQALTLPETTAEFGTLEQLAEELCAHIRARLEVEEQAATLIAAYGLATWVADCLPLGLAPLNVWGRGSEPLVAGLLRGFCRRPLVLSEPSLAELTQLPAQLYPTLVLMDPSEHALARLLAASQPHVNVLRGGRVLNVRCSVIACTRQPLSLPTLSLRVFEATPRSWLAGEERQLAESWGARLARYRLRHHRAVASSQFDVPGFEGWVRSLARALGAAAEGCPQLQARIVNALAPYNEDAQAEQSTSLAAVVLEALLALLHEKHKTAATVLETTNLVNAILIGRHDGREVTPRGVGSVLRAELGLHPIRREAGCQIALDRATAQRVHRLAATHDVMSLLQPASGCALCREAVKRSHLEDQHRSGVQDVQHVQEVQDVQDVRRRKPPRRDVAVPAAEAKTPLEGGARE